MDRRRFLGFGVFGDTPFRWAFLFAAIGTMDTWQHTRAISTLLSVAIAAFVLALGVCFFSRGIGWLADRIELWWRAR